MSKQEERRATALFDQYVEEVLKGLEPDVDRYLAQCPPAEADGLRDAFYGVGREIQCYYASQVKQNTVLDALTAIQEIRRNRDRLAEAAQRAVQAQTDDLILDYKGYLTQILACETPATGFAQGISRQALFNRGRQVNGANARQINAMWQRALEKNATMKADETLQQAGIESVPVDLARIADYLFLYVGEMALEGIEGCLKTDGKIGGVLINKNVPDRRRRRFTLGHEIGHFVLHKDRYDFADTANEIANFSSSLAEIECEANFFSARLLMPAYLMPPGFDKSEPTFDQADTLKDMFDVSMQTALRRIVDVSHWRSAFVVTRHGSYVWAARSSDFEGFFLQRPHPNTMASLMSQSDGTDEDSIRVPASAWVEGPLVEEGAEIFEQARSLGDGYVYSILTVVETN